MYLYPSHGPREVLPPPSQATVLEHLECARVSSFIYMFSLYLSWHYATNKSVSPAVVVFSTKCFIFNINPSSMDGQIWFTALTLGYLESHHPYLTHQWATLGPDHTHSIFQKGTISSLATQTPIPMTTTTTAHTGSWQLFSLGSR